MKSRNNYYINGIILEKHNINNGLSIPFRPLKYIIHPITGITYKFPSNKVRCGLVKYYMKNEGEIIRYNIFDDKIHYHGIDIISV